MTWLVDADVKEPVIETGVNASGGTESVVNIGGQLYRVHKFTDNGTFTVSTGGAVECLIVGGGGAGGQTVGSYSQTFDTGNDIFVIATGGGGGGGVVRANINLQSTGSYPITVGAGGQIDTTLAPNEAPSNTSALDGGDSKISFGGTDLLTAKGGGGGAINTRPASLTLTFNGRNGGSGGGGFSAITFEAGGSGSGFQIGTVTNGGSGILGQGNNGADGFILESGPGALENTSFAKGGGGGGAFSVGKIIDILIETDSLVAQPSGGNGVQSDITGFVQTYGGGGGGTSGGAQAFGTANIFGAGGSGGGGNGARGFPITVESQAGANGFGGGGGCGYTIFTDIDSVGVESVQASNGGSGVVIIRYPIGA